MEAAIDGLTQVIGASTGPITFWQMLARALIVFIIGVLLVRFSTPRLFGRATPIDIVLAVVIGSNLSRTMMGNAPFVEVVAATILLAVAHGVVTRLAAEWRPLATLVKGRTCQLIKDGEIDSDMMRKCAVGERDLLAAVREAGGVKIEQAHQAYLERSGDIFVVLKDPDLDD